MIFFWISLTSGHQRNWLVIWDGSPVFFVFNSVFKSQGWRLFHPIYSEYRSGVLWYSLISVLCLILLGYHFPVFVVFELKNLMIKLYLPDFLENDWFWSIRIWTFIVLLCMYLNTVLFYINAISHVSRLLFLKFFTRCPEEFLL